MDGLRTLAGSAFFYIIFFFQAEDGIRDLTVTGVQTCALPIYHPFNKMRFYPPLLRSYANILHTLLITDYYLKLFTVYQHVQGDYPWEFGEIDELRSEERRVGKSVDIGSSSSMRKKKKEIQTVK